MSAGKASGHRRWRASAIRRDIPPEAVSATVSLDGVMVALRAGGAGRDEACWREDARGTVSFHDAEGLPLRRRGRTAQDALSRPPAREQQAQAESPTRKRGRTYPAGASRLHLDPATARHVCDRSRSPSNDMKTAPSDNLRRLTSSGDCPRTCHQLQQQDAVSACDPYRRPSTIRPRCHS